MTARSRYLLIASLMAAAGIAGGVYWLLWPTSLPGPDTQIYRAYVRAFQVGVAALDSGREDLALDYLVQAVSLIPAEPAAWADLGLFHLRKNNLPEAARALMKAHRLAPESGDIEALLGYLAEKQGRQPEAVAHLRIAVEKNPRDLAALYVLAEAVSREGGADSETEYQRLLEQILQAQPNNLPVLVMRAGAAVRRKDPAAYRDSIDRLGRLAPGWTPLSVTTFDELRKLGPEAPNEQLAQLQLMDNVLKAERGYSRDSRAIRPQPGIVGTPIYAFLRLQPMRSTPAPPDSVLTFRAEPMAKPGERWDLTIPVWRMTEEQRASVARGAGEGGVTVRGPDALTAALYVANAREVRRADGARPALTFPGGKSIAPTSAGVLTLDWDNDFRTDLLCAGAGGLRFWRQTSDGAFEDVTAKTGLPADILNADYHGAWAVDIEMDGDLDIVAARRNGSPVLLRNNGDGTFKAIELFPTIKDVRGFAWADLDNDGAPDAVFLDVAGSLHIFANDRSGQFSAWPLPDNLGTFLAIAAADINSDGVFDIVALRKDGALVRISDQDKRRSWQVADLTRWRGAGAAIGTVTLFAEDFDNNGAIDLLVAGPNEATLFLADAVGKWEPLPDKINLRVTAALDLDQNGRLDLLGLTAEGQPMRALNQSTKGYRWQALWPLANPNVGDNRINSFAIGGEIEVRSGSLVQKQTIRAPVVHFGLGEQEAVDVARIVWPNGVPQWEFDVPADRLIAAAQRLSGSCPFLFTFDGAGMRFVGDFMWGTPLGMYVNGQNTGDFPQTTEWLKIRGEHLVPRDGYYDVRVHANLWEADYFDQLALIVVDHPPDTEIHVDERFFLTPTPPRLYVTTPAKPVARAWDHHGQDATADVRAVDGRYLDRAGRGRFQGVMRDHWVEFDLGDDAPRAGPVLLIARGWLHPTNSSINVALSQGKHDAPSPLVLEVSDGKGGWKAALPALGFPAGKDKTLVIRLDGLDRSQNEVPRRFRIRTSMEIYWDFIGYATELSSTLAKLQRPEMASAELRYHGITAMTQKNVSSPEVPIYDKVIPGRQPWRDLTGFYTRFGDVRELLAKVDDRYVLANAGDEITLRFPVPPAPPAGWQRDFIWECDGWTRDGDLNTRFGNTVLPLPTHGKSDMRPPRRLEDDPVFQRFRTDWRRYHARYIGR